MSRWHPERGAVTLHANALITILLLLLSFILGSGDPPGGGFGQSTDDRFVTGENLRWDPESLRGKIIVVDPGHGGDNPGTRGVGPQPEKNNVLAVGWDLQAMLEYAGATVVMTRDGDYSPGGPHGDQLAARVQIANASRAHAYVSIHNDWNDNSALTGSTTYFFSPAGYRLGASLQRGVTKELKSKDLGVRWANYYVIKNTAMPAALVELGFLSNKQEAHLLSSRAYQVQAATGIYNGLVEYFSNL